MTQPSIQQQITFLYTPNLGASSRFYEDTMGFQLALDQGTCRIYITAPNAYLGLCERADINANPANVIFTLVTADVDDWYERLKEKGVEFEKPPALNPSLPNLSLLSSRSKWLFDRNSTF